MKGDRQFPPEVKALFRTVITDALTVKKAQSLGVVSQYATFSPEGQDSYQTLKRMIDNDPGLESKFLDSREWCRDDDDLALALDVDVKRYITFAIDRQVARGELELTETDFESVWREICKYALCKTLDWQFLAPIKNLSFLGSDAISFRPWLKIRPLTDDEIEKPKDADSRFFDPPAHYGVEARARKEPRRYRLAPGDALEPLSIVLAALRLYKTKPVWLNSVTSSSNSPFDGGGLTWRPFEWTGHRMDPYCTDSQESYSLDRHDARRLCTSWEILWKSYHEIEEIRRSIDLYNEAFEQSTRVASFLRIWGAIEAAFVPRGVGRIADSAATTLSELLEPAGGQRDDIKRRIRESYRCRSRVVHGGHRESDIEILSSSAFAAKCYRRAILARLEIKNYEDQRA